MAEIINLEARREKEQTEPDPGLVMILEGLRDWVDNMNQAPSVSIAGQIFKAQSLDNTVHSVKHEAQEYGYRLIDGADGTLTREVFCRFEQPIKTIPEEQKDPILLAIFDTFLMEGQGEVVMSTFQFGNAKRRNSNTHDCIRISQEFSPLILTRTDTAKTHIKIDDDIERLLQ